jgi:hypothetical protein
MEVFVKCVAWYIGASMLAALPCLAFGGALRLGLAQLCVVGLPSMLGFLLVFWLDVNDLAVLVAGYLVQIGLVIAAVCARKPSTRRRVYLVFVGLLIADVIVAWVLPPLYLALRGFGE